MWSSKFDEDFSSSGVDGGVAREEEGKDSSAPDSWGLKLFPLDGVTNAKEKIEDAVLGISLLWQAWVLLSEIEVVDDGSVGKVGPEVKWTSR